MSDEYRDMKLNLPKNIYIFVCGSFIRFKGNEIANMNAIAVYGVRLHM